MSQYEKVEELLKNYRENKSDRKICASKFNKFYHQLKLHETAGIECIDEVIAGMAVGAQHLSDIPRSETNKFHSATENVAIDYRTYLVPSKLEIEGIKQRLQEIAEELKKLDEAIENVDNMLISLTDRERYIIESMYLKGFKGTQVMLKWNEENANCAVYDIKVIYGTRNRALSKMLKRLKQD